MSTGDQNFAYLWIQDPLEPATQRRICIIGGCIAASYASWKCLRFLSRCGNSQNVVLRSCHKLVRRFMNTGFIMRMTDFNYPTELTICNYGTYGIIPKDVWQYQQSIKEEVESCPDKWYRQIAWKRWKEAVDVVAEAVGANSDDLVLIKNVTESINCVFHWLPLKAGDEIAISTLSYSAVRNTFFSHAERLNLTVQSIDISFPIELESDVIELYQNLFEDHPNIKFVLIDHITSASAVMMPVKELVKICHNYGAIVFVDGAHAPGQIRLDVQSIGADFYAGNLYKWYYAPRPSAFLYVKKEHQSTLKPMLVSHNYKKPFQEKFFKQGVCDYSAVLAAAYAVRTYYPSIGGMEHLHWYNTSMLKWAVDMFTKKWGTERLQIPESMQPPFMAVIKLPPVFDQFYPGTAAGAETLMRDLLVQFGVILMPVIIDGILMIRITTQICSSKRQYYYAAKAIMKKASQLENLDPENGRPKSGVVVN